MNSGQLFTMVFIVTIVIGVPTVHSFLSLSNPFDSLRDITKNEASDVLSDVMSDVRRMQIKNQLSSLLLRGEPMPMMGPMAKLDGKKKLQSTFNWTSCGSPDQSMEIKSLSIAPSPLSFPGKLTFGFDIVFHETISTTEIVAAALELYIITSSSKIKLPCLGVIGSCTYKDLCSMLSAVSCPTFKKRGIPCKCPFKKGEYVLKDYSVTVLSEVFPAGNYEARANLTSPTKGAIGCYDLKFSVI